jgi:ribosomal protein S18 acetylase RimI-like enzyme
VVDGGPGRMRLGGESAAELRRMEELARTDFERFDPAGGADWVGKVLGRRERGEVRTGVWEDGTTHPGGWLAWESVPSAGRRVVLSFLEPSHRSGTFLGEMLTAFGEFEPLSGPAFFLPDAIPGLSLDEQSTVLESAGWIHFDRWRMIFPRELEVAAAPLQMAWRFRSLTPEDERELFELYCRAYRDYPGQLEWAHVELERDMIDYTEHIRTTTASIVPGATLVALVEGHVRGSVIARRDASGPYIDSLQVDPLWHGRGLGRALLVRALSALREGSVPEDVRLKCLGQNERAVALYRSVGFRVAPDPRHVASGYWVRRKTLRAVLARPGNEKFR